MVRYIFRNRNMIFLLMINFLETKISNDDYQYSIGYLMFWGFISSNHQKNYISNFIYNYMIKFVNQMCITLSEWYSRLLVMSCPQRTSLIFWYIVELFIASSPNLRFCVSWISSFVGWFIVISWTCAFCFCILKKWKLQTCEKINVRYRSKTVLFY